MKTIGNPNYSPASAVTAADKTDLQAALVVVADRNPTFAEVRAAMPAGKRGRMTDGMIHAIAAELALPVSEA